jgi:hypothetical protein
MAKAKKKPLAKPNRGNLVKRVKLIRKNELFLKNYL